MSTVPLLRDAFSEAARHTTDNALAQRAYKVVIETLTKHEACSDIIVVIVVTTAIDEAFTNTEERNAAHTIIRATLHRMANWHAFLADTECVS